MKRIKTIVVFSVAPLLAFCAGCDYVHCDNAEVCVVNKSNDTIHYNWNNSSLDSVLPPGHIACDNVGIIRKSLTYEETKTTTFYSDQRQSVDLY